MEELDLSYADIQEAGFLHLEKLYKLRKLDISYTNINDEGLKILFNSLQRNLTSLTLNRKLANRLDLSIIPKSTKLIISDL